MRCTLCPRACGADRANGPGPCGAGLLARVALADLHHFEEPCISGARGSGAVFFSGCNLRCEFCQNHAIRGGSSGPEYTSELLARLYLDLAARGAHNINLVTAAPHVPAVAKSLTLARSAGLRIPVVYNSNAYETCDALSMLDGLVDVYLPDLKYVSPVLSARFSGAADYFEIAGRALAEMQRQVGKLQLDDAGLAQSGLIIRHLVLPGCVFDSCAVLDALSGLVPLDTQLSIMRQYTPTEYVVTPALKRCVTNREYERVIEYALSCGFSDVFIQDAASASLSYTPLFTD